MDPDRLVKKLLDLERRLEAVESARLLDNIEFGPSGKRITVRYNSDEPDVMVRRLIANLGMVNLAERFSSDEREMESFGNDLLLQAGCYSVGEEE